MCSAKCNSQSKPAVGIARGIGVTRGWLNTETLTAGFAWE